MDIFNKATRTADLLLERGPQGQLEMLDSAVAEGYATIMPHHRFGMELVWHDITAYGAHELEALDNWLTLALREAGEAA